MTRHDDTVCLQHILDHARHAVEIGRGKSAATLQTDRIDNLALMQLLVFIGRNAGGVSMNARMKYPAIDWVALEDRGVRLARDYDAIDYEDIASTVAHDLPQIIATLGPNLDKMGVEVA